MTAFFIGGGSLSGQCREISNCVMFRVPVVEPLFMPSVSVERIPFQSLKEEVYEIVERPSAEFPAIFRLVRSI